MLKQVQQLAGVIETKAKTNAKVWLTGTTDNGPLK